jgi:hypothetical protein
MFERLSCGRVDIGWLKKPDGSALPVEVGKSNRIECWFGALDWAL